MEIVKTDRVRVAWNAERQRIEEQIADWDDLLLGQELEDGTRDTHNAIRSDTAKVQALRHKQRCEEQLDRIDIMQQILDIADPIASASAKADLCTLEGSHGPAKEWTRLAMEMEQAKRLEQEAQRRSAEEVGAPTVELVRLMRDLLEAPQSVRADMASILEAGSLPEHWRPSLEVVFDDDSGTGEL
jgi:hypothetical protein